MSDLREKYLPTSLFALREEIERAVLRALRGEPHLRLTADEVAAELRAMADKLPTTPTPRRLRWWRRA